MIQIPGMLELRFQYGFEAAHRFTGAQSEKCRTPHGHSWSATLCLFSSQPLNQNEMVEEFESLKAWWRTFITGTVDHSYLHHWADPILPVLKGHVPRLRNLPFPGDPTTELISICFLHKALTQIASVGPRRGWPEFESVRIEIQETATNRVQLSGESLSSLRAKYPQLTQFIGWWGSEDLASRECQSERADVAGEHINPGGYLA